MRKLVSERKVCCNDIEFFFSNILKEVRTLNRNLLTKIVHLCIITSTLDRRGIDVYRNHLTGASVASKNSNDTRTCAYIQNSLTLVDFKVFDERLTVVKWPKRIFVYEKLFTKVGNNFTLSGHRFKHLLSFFLPVVYF